MHVVCCGILHQLTSGGPGGWFLPFRGDLLRHYASFVLNYVSSKNVTGLCHRIEFAMFVILIMV